MHVSHSDFYQSDIIPDSFVKLYGSCHSILLLELFYWKYEKTLDTVNQQVSRYNCYLAFEISRC